MILKLIFLILNISLSIGTPTISTDDISNKEKVCRTSDDGLGKCQLKSEPCETIDVNAAKICGFNIFLDPYICCPDSSNNDIDDESIAGIETFKPSYSGIQCGRRQKSFLIVGGSEAPRNAYPWAVALYHKGRFMCGGSLINDRYVLTAAHCVVQQRALPANEFSVKMGVHYLSSSNELRPISRLKAHESYNPRAQKYDIALLRLRDPIDFSKTPNVAPICLPSPDMDNLNLDSYMAILVGWGTTSEGGSPRDELRHVEVPFVKQKVCADSYARPPTNLQIGDTQLCAGDFDRGNKDTCQGDSGGPLAILKDNIYYEMGIVSFGKGCAQARYPGVYTRVTKYLSWINTNSAS